jgi:hypothetical protein
MGFCTDATWQIEQKNHDGPQVWGAVLSRTFRKVRCASNLATGFCSSATLIVSGDRIARAQMTLALREHESREGAALGRDNWR